MLLLHSIPTTLPDYRGDPDLPVIALSVNLLDEMEFWAFLSFTLKLSPLSLKVLDISFGS